MIQFISFVLEKNLYEKLENNKNIDIKLYASYDKNILESNNLYYTNILQNYNQLHEHFKQEMSKILNFFQDIKKSLDNVFTKESEFINIIIIEIESLLENFKKESQNLTLKNMYNYIQILKKDLAEKFFYDFLNGNFLLEYNEISTILSKKIETIINSENNDSIDINGLNDIIEKQNKSIESLNNKNTYINIKDLYIIIEEQNKLKEINPKYYTHNTIKDYFNNLSNEKILFVMYMYNNLIILNDLLNGKNITTDEINSLIINIQDNLEIFHQNKEHIYNLRKQTNKSKYLTTTNVKIFDDHQTIEEKIREIIKNNIDQNKDKILRKSISQYSIRFLEKQLQTLKPKIADIINNINKEKSFELDTSNEVKEDILDFEEDIILEFEDLINKYISNYFEFLQKQKTLNKESFYKTLVNVNDEQFIFIEKLLIYNDKKQFIEQFNNMCFKEQKIIYNQFKNAVEIIINNLSKELNKLHIKELENLYKFGKETKFLHLSNINKEQLIKDLNNMYFKRKKN
jgi:hypothetical protein